MQKNNSKVHKSHPPSSRSGKVWKNVFPPQLCHATSNTHSCCCCSVAWLVSEMKISLFDISVISCVVFVFCSFLFFIGSQTEQLAERGTSCLLLGHFDLSLFCSFFVTQIASSCCLQIFSSFSTKFGGLLMFCFGKK